jgi:propionyl-CoA carboxylase beta chain
MNSKDLGADFAFAWPRARIGIMAAAQATRIVHRRELDAADDPAALHVELASRYAQNENAVAAAEDGFIDEVIAPTDTRRRLASALAMLQGKVGAHQASRSTHP